MSYMGGYWVVYMYILVLYLPCTLNVLKLSKEEGPNVCLDARFLIFFSNLNQLPAAAAAEKKKAFQEPRLSFLIAFVQQQ